MILCGQYKNQFAFLWNPVTASAKQVRKVKLRSATKTNVTLHFIVRFSGSSFYAISVLSLTNNFKAEQNFQTS